MVIPQKLKEKIGKSFDLDTPKLENVMKKFTGEIEKGLKKATQASSEIKCFVTYVQKLPTGTEVGQFLALDLGGTNFRVLLIHLKGEQNYEFESEIYAIPQSLMVGTGEALFDHIAKCLAEFSKQHNVQDTPLPLGFTFSFPCEQRSLTEGILMKWTKGFNASDCVNKNVVSLLERSLKKRNDVKILVCAILNDTTGTLMSCAWKNQNCKIGLIIGTGANACYLEKAENAEFFDKPGKGENVIINTECGAFGDNGNLEDVRNDYDREIDENSINPKNQLFEKMISGEF